LALGFCNLGNGLMQGFPISSSGSRTAIGESLGSKTQLFSVVAFIMVILVLLFLRPILALFPKAALGAIVIYAGSRLIEIPAFVRLYRFRFSELGLAIITSLGVIFTDIVTGVIVAVLLSLLEFALRVTHSQMTAVEPQASNTSNNCYIPKLPGVVIYRQAAPLFFANADKFKCRVLAAITETAPPVKYVVLDASGIGVIDITAIEMLEDLQDELTNQGIVLSLVDVQPRILAELQRAGFIDRLGTTQFFPTMRAFMELKEASPSTTI
jgi:sulfate permease, SulP family